MLWRLHLQFLRLGCLGFGGPLALIALMEQEFVARQGWVTPKQFQEAFTLIKMFPGPIAFQMALWLGRVRAGFWGGLLAGVGFLLPGVAAIIALAIGYQSVSGSSAMDGVFNGIRAAALWIILLSLYAMAKPYLKEKATWVYATVAAALWFAFPRWEPLVILAGGLFSVQWHRRFSKTQLHSSSLAALWALFWVHFKAGATVFGTGLAILPVLQAEVVEHYRWLSAKEFLDAVAFGQLTPGPITIVSTYIGLRSEGALGAFVATLGMYLPGTILILGVLPLFEAAFLRAKWLSYFQKGAVPTVIGCLVASVGFLAKDVFSGTTALVAFGLCVAISYFRQVPPWAYFLLGGGVGWAGSLLTH